jgi:hypothetical protein
MSLPGFEFNCDNSLGEFAFSISLSEEVFWESLNECRLFAVLSPTLNAD